MSGEDRPDTSRACLLGEKLTAVAVRGAPIVALQLHGEDGSMAATMLSLEDVQQLTRWMAQWIREQPAPGETL